MVVKCTSFSWVMLNMMLVYRIHFKCVNHRIIFGSRFLNASLSFLLDGKVVKPALVKS